MNSPVAGVTCWAKPVLFPGRSDLHRLSLLCILPQGASHAMVHAASTIEYAVKSEYCPITVHALIGHLLQMLVLIIDFLSPWEDV